MHGTEFKGWNADFPTVARCTIGDFFFLAIELFECKVRCMHEKERISFYEYEFYENPLSGIISFVNELKFVDLQKMTVVMARWTKAIVINLRSA